MTDEDKILKLRTRIRRHNHLYYDLDDPELTDIEYDSLIKEMKNLSPDDPVLNEMGNPTFGTKVSHSTIMGSLDKVHSMDEIIAKFDGQEVCIMPKVDGLSLAVRYDGGQIDWAATRGNGKIGELVTPSAVRIDNMSLSVDIDTIEVRGESYISKGDFYGIMDQPGYDGMPDGYANPRNAAAGAIRQKDPKEVYNRHIGYVSYKVIGDHPFKTQFEALLWLQDNGFKTVDCWIGTIDSNDTAWLKETLDEIEKHDFDYNIDGAVIMINDLNDFETMGHGAKCPKGAVAFKYSDECAESIATDIIWEASRTGRIVPVLTIEPTDIDGSVVSRITLNNYSWMIDKDVAIGDTILFTKANGIIPCLVDVVDRVPERNKNIPDKCPSCGTTILMNIDFTTGILADMTCPNELCPAKFIKSIRRILEILEVKGIDETTIEKMADAGLLVNIWDIFDIDTDMLNKAGFGKVESSNWVKSVQNITTTPECLLSCMCIPGWGRRMFENLFNSDLVDVKEWVDYLINTPVSIISKLLFENLDINDTICSDYLRDNPQWNMIDMTPLLDIDGIGPERFKTLQYGIVERKSMMAEISKRITIEYPEKIVGGVLTGKSFCCTGTLTRKRKDIQADIVAAGGEIKSGVTSKLDYLITGDATGSKLTKALKLGVKVINEDELNEMMK